MKGEETYKPVGDGSGKKAIEELRNEIISPLENDIQKLRDPVVLAALMHTAATERENTNRLLKTLIEKLDSEFSEIDTRLDRMESKMENQGGVTEEAMLLLRRRTSGSTGARNAEPSLADDEMLLPAIDEGIMKFVKEKRHATAEEVRRRFGYKGKNAASARLNRMFEMGLLVKKQVGRAVLYSVNH